MHPGQQPNCIFCKIASGEIESDVAHEDERCIAFHDLNPQAPTHVLLIPKRHIENVGTAGEGDGDLLGHLLVTAPQVAEKVGLAKDGYRLVLNVGRYGGQSVDHLHIHILGGRPLKWPPG